MSDLLLMRGGGLRSLLSTPGLVALYLPYLQVAQSATGQSLIDYSPAGNHAQLGSTAGADTNDPSWGTNALAFGGDDYCVEPVLNANGDKTVFVSVNFDEGLSSYPYFFSYRNLRLFLSAGSYYIDGIYRNASANVNLNRPASTTVSAGTWQLVTARLQASTGYNSLSITGIPSITAGSGALNTSYYPGYEQLVGGTFSGKIATAIVFNRVLGDNEA